MSLINDALKKAQKQRTGEAESSTPSVNGDSTSRVPRRGKPAAMETLVLRGGLGVAGLAVVGVGVYFLLPRSAAPTSTPPNPPVPTASVPATPPATSATPPVASPSAQVAVATPPPAATVPTVSTTPAPSAPAPALVVTPATKPAAPAPASPAAPVVVAEAPPVAPAPARAEPAAPARTGPLRLEGRAVTYIESIRVAGIRASSTDSKVLMNDRVYRVGDTVEHELGLRLAGITATSLTFEDERGARYTRNF